MLFSLGKCAGIDVVCDKCGLSGHFDIDDVLGAHYAARAKGWRIRVESNGPRMEGGYVYLCPECRKIEEGRGA